MMNPARQRTKAVSSTVHRVHFEDLGGIEFERLVFAYHVRIREWSAIDWYGQTGSDLGRDIWAESTGRSSTFKTLCVQCANRTKLTYTKIKTDIDKLMRAPNGVPQCFRVVSGSPVSSATKDSIKKYAFTSGIKFCDVWSGAEFEEHLRKKAESLLKRFLDGEKFPDDPAAIRAFVRTRDSDVIRAMERLFSRPAFYTPVRQESNLGDFRQAITDTIEALGTGRWKARDGEVLARIASRHELQGRQLRTGVESVELALSKLRAKFDEMVRGGVLKRCGCGQKECPTYYFTNDEAADELERLRSEALAHFRSATPSFVLPKW